MRMTRQLANCAFDPETTNLLGAAFDEAWRAFEVSGIRFADEAQVGTTRTILAKSIVLLAKQGERDMRQLVDGALASLEADRCLANGAGCPNAAHEPGPVPRNAAGA